MKIIYFHIPKTGGTSIKRMFVKWNRVILDNYDFRESQKWNYKFGIFNEKKDIPIEYIHIHQWTPWNFFEAIYPKKDDFTFTILREPVSQFYSIYHHTKRNYVDFIESQKDEHKNSLFVNLVLRSRDIYQFIDWVLDFGYLLRDQILPVGYFNKRFLDKMNFVGIFEEYTESIRILEKIIGVNLNEVKINCGGYNNDNYRKEELSAFFREETQIYNTHLEKFRLLKKEINCVSSSSK
jgi:hypothetical protein